MVNWSEETFKLIHIWSEDSIQAMLEGSKRNRMFIEGDESSWFLEDK